MERRACGKVAGAVVAPEARGWGVLMKEWPQGVKYPWMTPFDLKHQQLTADSNYVLAFKPSTMRNIKKSPLFNTCLMECHRHRPHCLRRVGTLSLRCPETLLLTMTAAHGSSLGFVHTISPLLLIYFQMLERHVTMWTAWLLSQQVRRFKYM